MLARARRELWGPGDRVAQALSIRKGAKLPLLVLALLLLPLPVLARVLLRILGLGCGPTFSVIVVKSFVFGWPLSLARCQDEIP
jgi:hypothetical protein